MAYTHIVRKRQRGGDGKWFRYPGRGYPNATEAIAAARRFAQRQCEAGVGGTEIDVIARKGNKTVVTLRWRDGAVAETVWMRAEG